MDPQDILTLAQHGDPKIIEALINHTTQPRGITARVRRRATCLHVLLESPKALNQQASVAFVRKRLESLNVEPITTVKIYGRQAGQKEFVWNQEIPLLLQADLLNPLDQPLEDHPVASTPAEPAQPLPALSTEEKLDPARKPEENGVNEVEEVAERGAMAMQNEQTVADETAGEADIERIMPSPVSRLEESPLTPPLPGMETEEATPPEEERPHLIDFQEDTPDLQSSPTSLLVTPVEEEAVLVEAVLVEEDLDWDKEDEIVLFSGDRLAQSISEIVQRPEAIIFLVFVALVMVWDLYLDLMTDASENGLSGRELARRLGVNHSTISRRKEREDFSLWSKTLDPDGIAWIYQNGGFIPQFEPGH